MKKDNDYEKKILFIFLCCFLKVRNISQSEVEHLYCAVLTMAIVNKEIVHNIRDTQGRFQAIRKATHDPRKKNHLVF